MTAQEALSSLRKGLEEAQDMERKFYGKETYTLPELECLAVIEKALTAQQARIAELEQAVRVRDEALRMLAVRTMLIYCMVKEKTGSLSCEDNCHTAYDSSQCIQNRINAALEAAGGENGNGRI